MILERLRFWWLRRRDRVRWRTADSRDVAFLDHACRLKREARAARRGGFHSDAQQLAELSNLVRLYVADPGDPETF